MKNLGVSRILWALVFAFAILASAFVFKGNPAVEWIEAGLIGVAFVFVVLKPIPPVCPR